MIGRIRNQRYAVMPSERFESAQSPQKFFVRIDIGIGIKEHDFVFLRKQEIDTMSGANAATGMKKNFHGNGN